MIDVGAAAPDFTLKDQNGRPVSLRAHRGETGVLLVFFPLAFTGICQRELDDVQAHVAGYSDDGVTAVAVSVGPPPTHKVWAAQSGFTFPLLSDFWPHGEVAQAYGVFNADAGFANRGTFAVDRAGVVRFAAMNGPGETRDQSVWAQAVAALRDG